MAAQPVAYFAQYFDGGDVRAGFTLFFPGASSADATNGLSVEIVQAATDGTHSSVSIPIPSLAAASTAAVVDSAFLDVFDLTSLTSFSSDVMLNSPNSVTVALVLRLDGTVIDTLGDPDGTAAIAATGTGLTRNGDFAAPARTYQAGDYDGAAIDWSNFGEYHDILPEVPGGPTVTALAPLAAGHGNAASVDFRLDLSEAVSGLTADAISLLRPANGTGSVTGIETSDHQHYVVHVSGLSGDGAFHLLLNGGADAVQDPAGRALGGDLGEATYQRDATPPALLSIVPDTPAAAPAAATSLVFDVAFSEAVLGLTAASFAASGSTAAVTDVASVAGSPGSYRVTVAGGDLGSVNGAVTLSLATAAGIADAAGNALSGPSPLHGSAGYTLDHTPPQPAGIAVLDLDSSRDYSAGDSIILRFSEPIAVSGLDVGQLIDSVGHGFGTGATLAAVAAADGWASSFVLTLGSGTTLQPGDQLSWQPGAVVDAAGNAAGAGSFTLPDASASVLSVTVAQHADNATGLDYLVAFNTTMQNVTAAAFSLHGSGLQGSIGTPYSTDGGLTWTVPVTGISGTGTLQLDVTGTGASSTSGDTLAAAFPGVPVALDTVAPTVTVIPSDPTSTSADTVHYTVTFSEAVTGFDLSDLHLATSYASGAIVTGVTALSATSYSVAVNTGAFGGLLDLTVNAAGIQDAAGNALGESVTGDAYAVDHNHAPLGVNFGVAVLQHQTLEGSLLNSFYDLDPGDTLSIVAVALNGGPATAVEPGTPFTLVSTYGILSVDAEGSYAYTAAGRPHWTSVSDTITVTVADSHGAEATAQLSFGITPSTPAVSLNFADPFTAMHLSYVNGAAILTAPDGTRTDVTGVADLNFTDGQIHENDGSPLVDDLYYYAHNLDVWSAHIDADLHYFQNGWREGRDPNAWFSDYGYLEANPDVRVAGINPLFHFDQFGWQEGRDPGPAFSVKAYLSANSDVAAAAIDPLLHYLGSGQLEGRVVSPGSQVPRAQLTGDFDVNYYLIHNPDVAVAGVDPYQHYLTTGWREGRDPSAFFSTNYYLEHNPDVAAAGVNPLLHYEQSGWQEGRNPSSAFSTSDYLLHNPDVAAAGMDPLLHYLEAGLAEGRQI